MKSLPTILASMFVVQSFFACNGESPSTNGDDAPAAKQTLVVSGDCTFAACGVLPSALSTEAKVSCESSTDAACAWSPSSDGTSVSYRYCTDSECASKPTIACPDETHFASQACGSENDGPCTWTTTCTPPRETTPCPQTTGCDELPMMAIGIICSDGKVGGFACVTDGQQCYWERNCD